MEYYQINLVRANNRSNSFKYETFLFQIYIYFFLKCGVLIFNYLEQRSLWSDWKRRKTLLDSRTWNYLNITFLGALKKEGSNETKENSTLCPCLSKDHCHLMNWIWSNIDATCPLVDRENRKKSISLVTRVHVRTMLLK